MQLAQNLDINQFAWSKVAYVKSWLFDRKLSRTRRPIVIGGCARSGTSLLLSLLSCHPQIIAIPVETQTLCPTAYYPRPNLQADFEIETLRRHLSATELSRRPQRYTARYWCEKTPRNVHYYGRILSHFGEVVKVITLVRDGRDVICSKHPDDADRFWVSPQRWVADVSAGVLFEDHPQVLTIRFEDLIREFDASIQRIGQFLSLDGIGYFQDYPKHATITSSNAWFGPAGPISQDSIGKWKAEKFSMRVAELTANPEAARLLEQYGYQ